MVQVGVGDDHRVQLIDIELRSVQVGEALLERGYIDTAIQQHPGLRGLEQEA